jgi:hypothetical protein
MWASLINPSSGCARSFRTRLNLWTAFSGSFPQRFLITAIALSVVTNPNRHPVACTPLHSTPLHSVLEIEPPRSQRRSIQQKVMLSALSASTLLKRSLVVASRRYYVISAAPVYPQIELYQPPSFASYFNNKLSSLAAMMEDFSVWNMSSTRKKRVKKMNKHKLRKRRKRDRLKTRNQ